MRETETNRQRKREKREGERERKGEREGVSRVLWDDLYISNFPDINA